MRGSAVFRTGVAPGGALAPRWTQNVLWRSAKAVPSLDLRFAESKSLTDAASGQSLVTFTRASSGTYVGSDGVLKTATTNEPRFDHNPTTGESLGLLVEEQRTNLNTNSEAFDTYSITSATVSANQGAAPNGSITADEITSTGAGAFKNISGTTASASFTASVYAKYVSGGGNFIFGFDVNPSSGRSSFNLQNGTIVSNEVNVTASSITAVGSGWYRCVVTATVTSTNTILVFYNATSGAKWLCWGAQLEAGAFPTSYIPTTTATATRSADVASITGTNFSSWYRQDEGTVFADATIANTGSNRFIVGASDATVNEEVALYWNTVFNSLVTDGAASQANSFGGTVTAGSRALHSFAYKANDFQGYGNAVALSADTSGTLPTADRLTIGSRVNSTFWTNGTIRRLCYWGQRLPNSTLQAITQ